MHIGKPFARSSMDSQKNKWVATKPFVVRDSLKPASKRYSPTVSLVTSKAQAYSSCKMFLGQLSSPRLPSSVLALGSSLLESSPNEPWTCKPRGASRVLWSRGIYERLSGATVEAPHKRVTKLSSLRRLSVETLHFEYIPIQTHLLLSPREFSLFLSFCNALTREINKLN